MTDALQDDLRLPTGSETHSGQPAIAPKSALIRSLGVPFVDVALVEVDPSDLRGLPVPDGASLHLRASHHG